MKRVTSVLLAVASVVLLAGCGVVETNVDLPSRDYLESFASTPWSFLLFLIGIVILVRLRLRIPEEARWNHEYRLPEQAMLRRPNLYPLVGLLALLVAVVGLVIAYVPQGLESLWDWVSEGGLESGWGVFLAVVSLSGLLAEVYLGIALVSSFIIFAQAAPPIPKWLLSAICIAVIVGTILLEIASLPATFWLIVVAILGSLLVILAAAWALWVSSPNNPLRVWFCTWIAPYFWTPYVFLWGTVWRCLKWGWVEWWEWEVRWVTKAWEILVEVWGWVTYAVQQVSTYVQTVVRRVQRFVNQYVPTWAQGVVNWVADTVVEFVDIVETIVVVVVTIIYVSVLVLLQVITIIVLVMVAMLVLLIILKLVCLAWALVVVSCSWILLWLWTIPVGFLRILFAN